MLKITQVRSYIGRPEKQRRMLRGLGLGKMNRTVVLEDRPEVRGVIDKIRHLVKYEEVEGKEI
ncbi:MAG: 50S ribosomal protein L30 [Deltaproteobacteria bacterium]|jgi:large subunit ribosomal protein L30|nr:50S ribosomal protein L30 [Deltaproteobacteria bacterium]